MSEIKRQRRAAAGLLLCIFLAFSAVMLCADTAVPASVFGPDDEDLYLEVLDKEVTEKYQTAPVTRETFVSTSVANAWLIPSGEYNLYNDISVGTVYFSKYCVSAGTFVKKGDRIADVYVTVDEAKLKELEAEIEAAQANLESFMQVNEALLDKYSALIAKGGNSSSEAKLLYERLRPVYEEEKAGREAELEKLRADYDANARAAETQAIYAPSDGLVAETEHFKPWQILKKNQQIAVMFDTTDLTIQILGDAEGLRYDMDANVIQAGEHGGENLSIAARVISISDASIAPQLCSAEHVLKFTGDTSELAPLKNVTVQYEKIRMENALVTDRKAISSDSLGNYVYKYENGAKVKQYVMTGGNNTTQVWILAGLEEGDTVICE